MKRIAIATMAVLALAGCSSQRSIDPVTSGSTQVPGTSWMMFCDGPNAFIWIPSRNDTDPDELEAIIYDHWKCVDPEDAGSEPKPRDEDGIIEDDDE